MLRTIKVVGGTTPVTSPTSMVVTSRQERNLEKESNGGIGKTTEVL